MMTRHPTIRFVRYCVPGLMVLAVVLIYALSSWAAGATQVNKVISGSTVPPPPGVLDRPRFARCPDSQHVVYARSVAGLSYRYFSTLINGTGQPVPVSDEGHDDSYMMDAPIRCSDGYVVYLSDQNDQSTTRLYSAPISGGAYITLTNQLVTDGDVQDFRISNDGRRAVYTADQETNDVDGLYSVPITGGLPISLSNTHTPYQFISFEISPDGTRVVYGGQTDRVLYSVPIDGGVPANLGDKAWVRPFFISPDSTRVVYIADRETAGVYELYSVPIAGGTPVKLNGALASGGDVDPYTSSMISSDGEWVVYRADQDVDEFWELYSVPITGSIPSRLSGSLVTGGNVEADGYLISPDNTRVVYQADQDADEVYELYSVPINGGIPIKLNGALTAGGDVAWYGFWISPDSTQVVYRADQDTDEVYELYRVSIAGSTAVKLNSALVAGGDVRSAGISPDNTQAVYRADQDTDEVWELYSVPLAGGSVTKVNSPLVANGDVVNFSLYGNGVYVVYRADQRQDERYELFVTYNEFKVYLPVVLRF